MEHFNCEDMQPQFLVANAFKARAAVPWLVSREGVCFFTVRCWLRCFKSCNMGSYLLRGDSNLMPKCVVRFERFPLEYIVYSALLGMVSYRDPCVAFWFAVSLYGESLVYCLASRW